MIWGAASEAGHESVVPVSACRVAMDGSRNRRLRSFGARAANRRELVERAAKAEQVTELKEVFKTANTVVVAHYAGLTVAQMQVLRKQARQAGTTVKVAKNRLAKIALEIGRAHV